MLTLFLRVHPASAIYRLRCNISFIPANMRPKIRRTHPGVARFMASFRRAQPPQGFTPTALVAAATASPSPGPGWGCWSMRTVL
jgi:hypothetical protein